MSAAEVRKKRITGLRASRWHLDEVFVKINGVQQQEVHSQVVDMGC